MREIERIKRIMGQINHIWIRMPDMRFFQLMNFIQVHVLEKKQDDDLFSLEDWDLEESLAHYIVWELDNTPE